MELADAGFGVVHHFKEAGAGEGVALGPWPGLPPYLLPTRRLIEDGIMDRNLEILARPGRHTVRP